MLLHNLLFYGITLPDHAYEHGQAAPALSCCLAAWCRAFTHARSVCVILLILLPLPGRLPLLAAVGLPLQRAVGAVVSTSLRPPISILML